MKHEIVSVYLFNAEGSREKATLPTLALANRKLKGWALKAPKRGACDKTDFEITFDDGSVYKGRFDLKYGHSVACNPIGEHVKDHCRFYVRKPHWMSAENYHVVMANVSDEDRKMYQAFLDDYNLEIL